jgi:hypothetical protein
MAGNNTTTPGNAMSNAWASAASKLNSFMPNANQVNGTGGPTGVSGGRRKKRSKKGTKKGSKKAGKKSRRRRKQKVLGFDIF